MYGNEGEQQAMGGMNRAVTQGPNITEGPIGRREPAIPVEFKRLQVELGAQMELITALEQRLEPVMRREPEPSERDEKELPPPPGIAGAINQASRAIRNNSLRLGRIVKLLEL